MTAWIVGEPISSPKGGDMRQDKKMARIWNSVNFDTGGEVKNDAHSELEFVELQA
jgi:hypothetical protein